MTMTTTTAVMVLLQLASLARGQAFDCGALPDGACNENELCVWRSAGAVCENRRCSASPVNNLESRCGIIDGCNYNQMTSHCVDKPCLPAAPVCEDVDSEAECVVQRDCLWTPAADGNGTCETHPCKAHDAKNVCEGAGACRWEALEGACDADGAFEVVENHGTCREAECSKNDRCSCDAQKGCVFHVYSNKCLPRKYAKCPSMDFIAVVDGSKSFGSIFGAGGNGYRSVNAQLKAWVGRLPLSGQASIAAKVGTGVNFAAVQFSGTPAIDLGFLVIPAQQKSYVSQITNGQLSGSAAELEEDLDFHKVNFLNGGSMMFSALEKAVAVFNSTPAGIRQRVLAVFTDGETQDAELYPPVLAQLSDMGVKVFGVLVHDKYTADTPNNLDACVSAPTDAHVAKVSVDNVEQVLADFCNPAGTFGSRIAAPAVLPEFCAGRTTMEDCYADTVCRWSAGRCTQRMC
ncbi:hypothetical protein DIPPA_05137 [Diplonema papillatum]|nr:hypothetical protein DIPPA_05137 [Diplonema papillatum]